MGSAILIAVARDGAALEQFVIDEEAECITRSLDAPPALPSNRLDILEANTARPAHARYVAIDAKVRRTQTVVVEGIVNETQIPHAALAALPFTVVLILGQPTTVTLERDGCWLVHLFRN